MRPNSPLKNIPELVTTPEISSLQDILKVKDFVFNLIPWKPEPKEGVTVSTLLDFYWEFKSKVSGGWCGINAEFLQQLFYWYEADSAQSRCGLKTRPINFGLIGHKITHVGVIVTYDGMEFFLDPYLGVHYNHRDGFPLTFPALIGLIAEGKLDRIIPVYSQGVKHMLTDSGWQTMTPRQMIDSVIATWPGYSKIMKEVFGATNPLLLMQVRVPDVRLGSDR
jgi:hypothetical protein